MARRLGLVRRIESVERGQQCLLLGGAQAPNGAADYAGGIVPQELRIAVKDAYRAAQITQAQASYETRPAAPARLGGGLAANVARN